MTDIQKISNFLKTNDMELYEKFRKIVAMARSRQDARQEINAQSMPLFKHLIPYALMKKKGIVPPGSWKSEIYGFLHNIDVKNSGKKKMWFSAPEILDLLNSFLDPRIEQDILKKIEIFSEPTKRKIIPEINKFFAQKDLKLESIGIGLQYIPGKYGKKLELILK